MTNLTILITVVIVLLVIFKIWIAKNKTPEQRSSFEKILASLFVIGQKNMDEAADAVRTPEISRLEALQKTKEAMKSLNEDYQKELSTLILHRDELKDKTLPTLKSKPGLYLGKATTAKKKWQEAQEGENADAELAAMYKSNACMYLDYKKKAEERIQKAEKYLRDCKINIEKAAASFDARKATLEDFLQELEMMGCTAIPTARFNANMNMIRSLRDETANLLRRQNANIEADSMIQGSSDPANPANINQADYESEFDSLK